MLESSEHSRKSLKENIKDIFSSEVESYLNRKKNMNLSSLLRLMDNIVDESTFRRNASGQFTPSEKTIKAFYKVKFKVSNENDLLPLVPPLVKKYISNYNNLYKSPVSKSDNSKVIDKLIFDNPLFAEIYGLSSFNDTIPIQEIERNFGLKGVKIINKMANLGAVTIDSINRIIKKGEIRSTFSKKAVYALISSYSSDIESDTTNEGRETAYIQFDTLNEEGVLKWIEIDRVARKEKMKIANDDNFQGNIKVCSAGYTRVPCVDDVILGDSYVH